MFASPASWLTAENCGAVRSAGTVVHYPQRSPAILPERSETSASTAAQPDLKPIAGCKPSGPSSEMPTQLPDLGSMDAFAVRPRAWRLSCRRHGPRQDHPGAVIAVGTKADRQRAPAQPSRRAGVTSVQLDRRDREIRP